MCIHFGAGITQTGFGKIQLLSYSNVPVTHFNQFYFFEQILAGIFGKIKKRSILSTKNNNNLFDVFFIGIFFKEGEVPCCLNFAELQVDHFVEEKCAACRARKSGW